MTTQADIQWPLALIRESNDAAALFSRGLEAMRTMRHDYTDAVAVMSLLALGAEKMLKLTIGLVRRDQGTGWPSKDYMRQDVGHRILKADRIARPLLDTYPGIVPGLLVELKRQVNAGSVLPVALEALDRFGDAGRFYYLDVLASATQTQVAPQTLWSDMTTTIAESDPSLLADLASVERYDQGRQQLNDTMTAALTGWWDLYVAAWRTGAIGDEAKQYAREITLQESVP
ncbi:hypothetical protein HH310_42515 [Actinoplanes sp. TBRC 11911]|uniref:hypothetical protein n=1 Tax=Actinoplanes sp. TBRC 11911 TaxID=2729386 RepID=UPI00145C8A79|nr:hypothetical protein [Actinoplanes sp. TBRC 11911]NMO57825.1 hypothetical protein [Actinoplanes sp. TBRC 11911]